MSDAPQKPLLTAAEAAEKLRQALALKRQAQAAKPKGPKGKPRLYERAMARRSEAEAKAKRESEG